jgi:hypothetical protein
MRFFLCATVAMACFAGLSRAGGGYGAARGVAGYAPAPAAVQFVPQVRQQVDIVNEVQYVPQVRQRAVVRDVVDYVPVQSAPLAAVGCYSSSAAGFGVSRSFSFQAQSSRLGGVGRVRERSLFIQRSRFR